MVKASSVVSGLIWNTAQVLINQFSGIIVKLVLARLLEPGQFGLISMAVVFTGLVSTINELGMTSALIQKKEEDLTPQHFSSAFCLSLAVSVVLYLIGVFAIAPAAAAFYDSTELGSIIPWIMLPLLFNPFGLISRAKLTRDLNFKKLSLGSIVSAAASGLIAILLAYLGYGVWALVVQGVTAAAVNSFMNFIHASWRPSLKASWWHIKDILGYSTFVLLNNVTVHFTKNMDYLLVGKILGATPLGVYTIAFMIPDLIRSQIMGILNTVLFPVYSKIQSNPKELLKHYQETVKANSMLIFPMLAILISFPLAVIDIAFGPKWSAGTLTLQILALSAMVHVGGGSSSTVLSAIGKSKLDFQLMALTTVFITVPAFYIGIKLGGIEGCACGALIGKFLSIVARQIALRKYIGMDFNLLFWSNLPGITGAAATCAFAYLWTLLVRVDMKPVMIAGIALSLGAGYAVNYRTILPLVRKALKK